MSSQDNTIQKPSTNNEMSDVKEYTKEIGKQFNDSITFTEREKENMILSKTK